MPSSVDARFCTRCGLAIAPASTSRPSLLRLPALPFRRMFGWVLAYSMRMRRERIKWLTQASGAASPINHVQGLSEGAKRVYAYLTEVTLRFGSAHSRVPTIARVVGLSEKKARAAIRELERRGLLSHSVRTTWHGRGAHSYRVRPVGRSR